MALNDQRQYISIKPGETKILPKDAKIISAVNYGNVNFTSSCNLDIPFEDADCYKMMWSTAKAVNPDPEKAPLYHVKLDYIIILGVKYILNIDPENEISGGLDTNVVENMLRSLIPQSIMKITSLVVDGTWARRYPFTLSFQTTESIAETIMLNIKSTGSDGSFSESGLFLKPIKTDCSQGNI